MADSPDIEQTVIAAILAGRMPPGTRLGESELAGLFDVSRTRVREAMMKLETRGIVTVAARRGWFVVEPSVAEARAAFQARKVIETGLLRTVGPLTGPALHGLRAHVEAERFKVRSGTVHDRTCALGDFHIHLARVLGNPLLTDIIRDLTARTVLVSMLYQSGDDAAASNADHAAILDALDAGQAERAAVLMAEHIDRVEQGLNLNLRPDPHARLRSLLAADAATAPPPADTA